MASTFSDLKIELIGTGEQVGTWGATTNTNLGTALEEAITGSANVSFSSADVTLTLTNTNGTQTARNLRLVCTGTSGGARNLILGSGCQINKLYLVQNDLADAVTIKNTTGTGVTIPAGKKQFVFNNGTNVIEATNTTINLTTDVTGILPVANGGTGAATLTGVVKGNGTSAFTAGQVSLTSEVTGTLPVANGGTGQTSYTNGQLLIGNTTGNTLTKATLTAGTGISITNGSGSVTIATSGVGDVVGPASSTDNAVARFDSTTGKLLQNSGVAIDDSNNVTGIADLSFNSGYGSSAPAYGCRAWVTFDGTTTPPTIKASGNVSGVTRNNTGDYTVTFSTAMPDANYAWFALPLGLSSAVGAYVAAANISSYVTTSSLRFACQPIVGSNTNYQFVSVAVFR